MEQGATRGAERSRRVILKGLILRQSVDSITTITTFSLAAYYKMVGNLEANVICCVIGFISNTITLAYNAYLLRKQSRIILGILKKTLIGTTRKRYVL